MPFAPEVQQLISQVEQSSGLPVHVAAEPGMRLRATIVQARGNSPAHLLRYKPGSPNLDYLVANQLGFLSRTLSLPPAECWDIAATAAEKEEGIRAMGLGVFSNDFARSMMDQIITQTRSYPVVLRQEDPQAWLNLAMNLEQGGNVADAETAYARVIALDPGGLLAERAEQARNRISGRKLREGGEVLRLDVVAFCREAMRLFASMPADEVKNITMEIAMLGTKGLSVSNPTARHTLRSLPGEFSGLQLLCYEYTGFKLIEPSMDIGFDIAAEYEEARRTH